MTYEEILAADAKELAEKKARAPKAVEFIQTWVALNGALGRAPTRAEVDAMNSVAEDASDEEFKAMFERIKRGEVK